MGANGTFAAYDLIPSHAGRYPVSVFVDDGCKANNRMLESTVEIAWAPACVTESLVAPMAAALLCLAALLAAAWYEGGASLTLA